ncbi:MAG TPA: hypothetical protein VFB43_02445 [Terracidiphilus sp.]|nr:hypothetical protein [Terracidiphilus sp.]
MASGTPDTLSSSTAIPSSMPRVVEHYSDYKPPFDVKKAVEKMVASVPSEFLVGLSEIVLTNTASLPRKRRRSVTKSRGRKVKIIQAAGLYHAMYNNQPAWIEIFVDRTLANLRTGGLWWLLPRELDLEGVVFHEIGHHIHKAIRPKHKEREDVADVWKVKLIRIYARKERRILRVILRALRLVFGPLYQRLFRKLMKWGLDKGYMSRAEYDESIKS